MSFLLSNYLPAKFNNVINAHDAFIDNLILSDHVRISTGYVSADALAELKKIIEINRGPYIELLIGMHYFEGFTKNQYTTALSLHNYLIQNKLGCVKVSNTIKYHGKAYSFIKNKNAFTAILGSSNLSSLLSADRLYEIDYLFSDNENVKQLDFYLIDLISKLGTNLDQLTITQFREYNSLLEGQYGVDKVSQSDYNEICARKGTIEFTIPVKTTSKSNLNVFFGKGRESKNKGFVIPRPWYEVELILPKNITSAKGFPRGQSFNVITDDGWSFKCKTSGDYSKNFRSEDDLKILGKWIKGRLEIAGALKVGELVTEDVLRKYGRDNIALISTSNPSIWLLDFKP